MTDKPEAPATIRADGFQEQCAPFVMPGYILVVIYLGKLLSRTGPGPVRDNNFPKYIYGQDKVGIALRHRSSHGQGLLFGLLPVTLIFLYDFLRACARWQDLCTSETKMMQCATTIFE